MTTLPAQTRYRSLLLAQFGAVCLLAILHLCGAAFGWYDRFLWYDIPLHLAGGAWAGLAILWASRREGFQLSLPRALLVVFLIGVAWELFEFVAKVPQHAGYTLDTLKDLADDIIGGLIAFVIAHRWFSVDAKLGQAYGETHAAEIHELPGTSA